MRMCWSKPQTLQGLYKANHTRTRVLRWHGDIKPENILFVQGQYKLCDPGEALIRRATNTKTGDSPPRGRTSGGTRSYGKSSRVSPGEGVIPSL